MSFKEMIVRFCVFLFFLFFLVSRAFSQNTVDLSGQWKFRLDPRDQGIKQRWFAATLPDRIHLPGSLQCQGYGNDITAENDWYSGKLDGIWRSSPLYAKYRRPGQVKIFQWLQPLKHYIGPAWYQRTIQIPLSWKDKMITLFLERVHWSSTLWVDDHKVGTKISLATAHEYDLSKYLAPGSVHTLTIRVDNSQIVNIGNSPHSVSDETQTAWNGIIGKIRLQATPPVRISDLQVYPDIGRSMALVKIAVHSNLPKQFHAHLLLKVRGPHGKKLKPVSREIALKGRQLSLVLHYPMGRHVTLWDEFHPALYHLTATLETRDHSVAIRDTCRVTFGMRELTTKGTRFQLNGHIISWRGDVNCGVFPLTGYPAMDTPWWRKLFKTYKAWGLNAVRFHSWCPPEAAFAAADETGMYLQPEVDEWCNFNTPKQDSFFRKESALMLKRYGNHPSFCLMALGNERRADSAMLYDLVNVWEKDSRRLYTGKSAGNPVLDNFQYYNCGQFGPIRIRYHKGWPPTPSTTLFNTLPPRTSIDFRKGTAAYDKPLIAHETGQRCAYPDVTGEPAKYTGLLKAAYLDIARDQLSARGMLEEVPDFVRSSGLWQVQLYKEEIEANMRTPGIGGLNLLSLEDFPGQNTAPVGLLDVFYQAKGYVTPEQFTHFCGPVVLLSRMARRVWESDDVFSADIELYNFGKGSFKTGHVRCEIKDTSGQVVYSKNLPGGVFPLGDHLKIGSLSLDLDKLASPARYTLSVSAPGTGISNQWNFWVYPAQVDTVNASSVIIAHHFNDEVEKELQSGRTVLLLPDSASIKGRLPICFTDFYWTAFGLTGGESSADGLLCDPSDPVFKYFPTSFHTDWQWWDLLTHARPMILDYFKDPAPFPKTYRPLVQMIDSWKVNRKLGVLIAGKVGRGRLMICSIDLEHHLDKRPATRQFRYSLLKYITGGGFNPAARLTPAMIRNLFIQ
jgi:hypothetical protein